MVVIDAASGTALNAWSVVLPSPIGISTGVDQFGNSVILVSQDTKNQVSEYSPTGAFVRNIGSATAGSGDGQLKAPRDAATDSSGNIYVVDYGNDRISKFTATGLWVKNWGSSGGLDGQFRRPYGIDLDVNNTVYVADSTNHRIQVFDSDGTFLAKYGVAPPPNTQPGPGQFTMLRRVAVAPGVANPAIYGADLWGYKVDRITQTAGFTFTYDHSSAASRPRTACSTSRPGRTSMPRTCMSPIRSTSVCRSLIHPPTRTSASGANAAGAAIYSASTGRVT